MAHSRKRKKKSAGSGPRAPGWLWLAAGFALGLVPALGLYVVERAGPFGDGARSSPSEPGTAAPAPVAASPVTSRAQPAAEDPPEEERASRPRFEFYELLPEFEVVVPEVESRADPGPPPAEVEEPGRYVLQAGSFTKLADADRMQANLALLGIESRLQRVAIDDQVFHRVRIGPLSDLREINRIRNRLRDARIESLLMRAPPSE